MRNKEAMGLGDAKLLSAFGFLLGFQAVLPIVFIASLTGLIYVLPSLILNKKNLQNIIPFGPFIILLKYSFLINTKLLLFKKFNNLLLPISIIYIPIIVLFAMGVDLSLIHISEPTRPY